MTETRQETSSYRVTWKCDERQGEQRTSAKTAIAAATKVLNKVAGDLSVPPSAVRIIAVALQL